MFYKIYTLFRDDPAEDPYPSVIIGKLDLTLQAHLKIKENEQT